MGSWFVEEAREKHTAGWFEVTGSTLSDYSKTNNESAFI